MKATAYPNSEAAANEANNKIDKPDDPSHEGYEFIGYDVDLNPVSGYVLVAKYSKIKKTVTYLDPAADNMIISSEIISESGSSNRPGDPSHANFRFKEWVEAIDEDGNIVYVASYEVTCSEAEPKECATCNCPICPSPKQYIVPNTMVKYH